MKKPEKDMPELFMLYMRHGMCIAGVVVVMAGGCALVRYVYGFVSGLFGV